MSRPSSSDGVRPVQKKPPKFAARRKARGIPIGSGDGRTARHGPPECGIDVESFEPRSDVARAESITGPDRIDHVLQTEAHSIDDARFGAATC